MLEIYVFGLRDLSQNPNGNIFTFGSMCNNESIEEHTQQIICRLILGFVWLGGWKSEMVENIENIENEKVESILVFHSTKQTIRIYTSYTTSRIRLASKMNMHQDNTIKCTES